MVWLGVVLIYERQEALVSPTWLNTWFNGSVLVLKGENDLSSADLLPIESNVVILRLY